MISRDARSRSERLGCLTSATATSPSRPAATGPAATEAAAAEPPPPKPPPKPAVQVVAPVEVMRTVVAVTAPLLAVWPKALTQSLTANAVGRGGLGLAQRSWSSTW